MKKIRNVFLATTAILATATGAFWTIQSKSKNIPVPTYQATEIYDGDTFMSDTGLKIRLAALDAPEIDRCDGPESKAALTKLIQGQNIYLKVVAFDVYNRLVAYVYTKDKFINQEMLSAGLAYSARPPANAPKELKASADTARIKKIGIYGSKCTQDINPDNPKCNIKGNNLIGEGTKVYHFPGCGQYQKTLVQLYQGDQWFCSESAARQAGYVRGGDCFSLKYK